MIDAGKGLEALGAGLLGPGPQDHPAVEHDRDPRQVLRRAAEGVRQICLGIRGIKSDGSLGAGQHNRLRTTLDQIAQGRRRIRHGVRAVGDNKAVIAAVVVPDTGGDLQPVSRGHVGAVQVQQLEAVHAADVRDPGNMGEQLLRGQLRRKAAVRHVRGDGAASADQQNLLHLIHFIRSSAHPRSRWSSAARPNRAARSISARSASVSACFRRWRSSRRNRPRRESSSARRHRSSAIRVRSRTSRA